MSPLPLKPCYRIGEVARWLNEPPYVLRFWETEFGWLLKAGRSKSSQRVYTRTHLAHFATIQHLLRVELYTIAGAKRQLELAKAKYLTGG